MLIAKSSLVDLFFFCRQLVSTQLRGGLVVLVPSARRDPQTGLSFPLRCPAVVSVQYISASTSAFDTLSFHVTPMIFLI